jgi:hypothetical protein
MCFVIGAPLLASISPSSAAGLLSVFGGQLQSSRVCSIPALFPFAYSTCQRLSNHLLQDKHLGKTS